MVLWDMWERLVWRKYMSFTFKRYIWLTEKYTTFIPLQGFLVIFVSFYNKLSPIDLVIYGVPHTIIYMIIGTIGYQIIVWQFAYFYLVVYYLNTKLNSMNDELKSVIHSKKNKFNF